MRIKTKKIAAIYLLQLTFTIALCFFCHNYVGINIIRFFLTISVLLREVLMFVLPLLIFSSVTVTLSEIKKNGIFLVLFLMIIIFISNLFHIALSGILGFSLLSNVKTYEIIEGAGVLPFFQIQSIHISDTITALITGISIGIYNSFYKNKYIGLAIYKIRDSAIQFMQSFFIPLLPIFVGGFLLKLFSENQMNDFISTNVPVFFEAGGVFINIFCVLVRCFSEI